MACSPISNIASKDWKTSLARKKKSTKPELEGRQPSTRTHENFAKASIVHEDAFVLYSEMEKPTLYGLERALRDQGHKVSQTTLWRWAKKHKWPERLAAMGKLEGLKLLDLEASAETMRILIEEGKNFDILTVIKGIQARAARVIGANLTDSVKERPEPDYFIRMTKFMADLEDVRRKGFQADVQLGSRLDLPEKEERPRPKPAEVPKLAEVRLMQSFSKPNGK
jgi:hypothetical protein